MTSSENVNREGSLLPSSKSFVKLTHKALWLGIILLISLWPSVVSASTLSQLVTALLPGQFAELTSMTGFNSGNILIPKGSGCVVGDYITQYANKAVWNSITRQFQFVGSPHGSCGVINMVIYNEASNTWSIGPQPNSFVQPQHSYDHNTIDPATGTMYWRFFNSTSFYKLTSGGSSWSNIASPNPGSVQCCGALEFFPDMARLIFIDGDWGIWSYNPSNNSWTHLARTNGNDGSGLTQYPMSSYTNFAEYSKLGFLVFGGGSNIYKMNSSGTITTLPSAPFGNVNAGSGSVCCSIAADPVTGNIIVIDGSGKLWELNPSGSGSWTAKTSVVTPSLFTAAGGTGESLISAPISDYGVIMYVKCNDAGTCKTYLYKHGASIPSSPPPTDTQSPTAPSDLTANVASSGQINLSWKAATDNVGVTGYRIFRQGTQIASVTGTTYQDTGLSPSTSYSYTIAAYDAAGNISSQSASASATTLTTPITATPPTPPSSGSVITLVDFGSSDLSNIFGLAGWSTVIKDKYTDYQNIGPGGTTIVVGSNYTYNYQGVMGTPANFNSGDTVRVTWYNNSANTVSFTPNITFTSPDRIIAGTGTWNPMTLVTVPSLGIATSEFAFTAANAGSYSLVNVNVNYTNNLVIIADKIELIPVGSSTPASFDFSVSNGGNKSVIQGQSVFNSIATTLASGTTQAVSFSASGLPAGATASFNPASCTPNCNPTLNISTTGATPMGTATVTVAATGGGLTRTTAFVLTVSAPTTPSSPSDFTTRCSAPGVLRCFGFDTIADLGGTYGSNFGSFNNSGSLNGVYLPNSNGLCGTTQCPAIDTTSSASGGGSLKFTIPSQSGAGGAGQWFTNFSTDLATQFGAGGEFWIQWRQRFDSNFVTNRYTGGDREGPKQLDISAGDLPGCTPSVSMNCRGSNVDIETVMQNLQQRGYAQMYGYIDRGSGPQQYQQFTETFGGSDFKFQNARPDPYCLYSQNKTNPVTSFPPTGNCIGYSPNEWMTFKVHMKLGNLSGKDWANSHVDLWIGREGQPVQPAIAWTGNLGASTNKYGKVWLLPYITNKDATQVHPDAHTWYDELIISTQDIADPTTSGVTSGGVPPAPPSGLVLR
jgi:chitodextrinase